MPWTTVANLTANIPDQPSQSVVLYFAIPIGLYLARMNLDPGNLTTKPFANSPSIDFVPIIHIRTRAIAMHLRVCLWLEPVKLSHVLAFCSAFILANLRASSHSRLLLHLSLGRNASPWKKNARRGRRR